ncbi:MAG: VWA domain-containing protein [Candidatus Omnitrophica bacterium]|nr:VWA domain-containing protein [Candidatus Omnitrophota bacterium]
MEWGLEKNFIVLWLVPLSVAFFWFSAFRKKARIRQFGEVPLVRKLIASFDPAKRFWKRVLLAGAILCMALALAQPHFKKREVLVERKGIDVIIAIDVSRSMLAKDVVPSRLEKAKLELSGLVDRLKEDRIGIVAFAGEAYIQCPLTFDKEAVKLFLSTVSPNLIPLAGTAIARAIDTSVEAFADKEKKYKAVILLTDGEDHEADPVEAARRAKKAGVRIFTIGIGTAEGSTLPDAGGVKKNSKGQIVLSKLNQPLLKGIARETEGAYFRSSRGELEIERLSHEIRQMAQKGLRQERQIEYEENYQIFLGAAFIFLLAEMAISERKKE